VDDSITSGDLRLAAHFGRPPGAGQGGGVVLCHGFPRGPRGGAASAITFPELADRIASEAGWTALALNFRGTGSSEGDFSPRGWVEDILAGIEVLAAETSGVWLLGVAEGGTLAMTAAAEDPRVRGVVLMGTPRDLGDVAKDAGKLRAYARSVGMIRTEGYPEDLSAWGREASTVHAVRAAPRVAPRPVMILHGTEDDLVPVDDARVIAAAVGPSAELHLVVAGAHRLRHDPRGMALLLGWMARQPITPLRQPDTPPGDVPPSPTT
jgi:putative redox protein